MIKIDWTKSKTKEERDVMLRRARITRAIVMSGWVITILTLIITFGLPCFGLTTRHTTNLTDFGRPLPIQSYYLYDISTSPRFELTLLAQGFTMITTTLSYCGFDHFLGLLILHVCSQLENLHLRLTHMGMYSDFNVALKYNVQDHIRLIRSVELIDNIFGLMLLVIVTFFSIMFCLQGFLFVNVVHQKSQVSSIQLIWFVTALVYPFLHMCLCCVVGEILVTQSEKIHCATYEYAWYNIDPKAAKNLIMITLRANKTLCIMAGKMFPMTMASFCNLLKTSAGYISVLLAKQN
ncbi:odorant receptor 43a-like [Harpegnathos saltator]|uniref:odorant receptor 43a-like n=1 Tax=Harpegnathos saltator TaxID=610380 RepID=UPI000DBEEE14|nr:odorant receptor 43a-like [Harpegnathos saltator]